MNSNNAFAIQIEAAAEKRRNGPYARPSYLRVVHPVDDDDTVVVLTKAMAVEREPAGAVSVPDHGPGLFVRLGDAVIRQLGFTMIVAAIVGMTIIGYWTGFNERVVLDTIASVKTIMATPLEPKIVAHDWDEVTGERIGGCDSPQTTKAGCRPHR